MRLTGIPRIPTTPLGMLPGRNPLRATRLPAPRLFTWRRLVAKAEAGHDAQRISGEGMGRYKP